MGKKRHYKGANKAVEKKQRQENADKWKSTRGGDPRKAYSTPSNENKRFEAYYKAQCFVAEEEWENFLAHLRSPLPACFRINPGYAFADKLHAELMGFIGTKIVTETSEIDAVSEISWCPNAYKLGFYFILCTALSYYIYEFLT
jgi:16S rRNA C967 or C1407 C5-methylase (RsmB/RsmF family)